MTSVTKTDLRIYTGFRVKSNVSDIFKNRKTELTRPLLSDSGGQDRVAFLEAL
jgi:hypothetical protein